MKAALLIATGFVIGFGSASLVFLSRRSPEPRKPDPVAKAPEKPADAPPVKDSEKKDLPAPKPEPEKPVPKPELKEPDVTVEELEADFKKLMEKGLSAYGSKELAALVEKLKKAGKAGLDMAIEKLLKGESGTDRFIAAAMLEALGDPAALPALNEALSKDSDELVRRMSSHAMAIIGTDAAVAGLRTAMTGDEDWGVRVNSAYGVAKLGNDDGLKLLQQSYESPDTPKEYKLAILGGLADIAHPSTAPVFREILATSTEMGYLLTAIHAVEKMKDSSSLAELQKLASTAKSDAVKKAAAKAIEAIQK